MDVNLPTFPSIDFYRFNKDLLPPKNARDLRGVFYQLRLTNPNTKIIDQDQISAFLNTDTLIDKAIQQRIISPETYEVRRRLFDPVEGFKIWRDIGMSVGNTIKTILPNAYWMRGLIEQGQHLGYAGIEGQCKAAMSDFQEMQYTCAYCGYMEDKKQRVLAAKNNGKNNGLEPAVFSCEHIIELGAMFLVSGIMIGTDITKTKQEVENIFRELYRSNYEMACCRCNYLKADVQVNKTIVPESSTGEPTIFVGWNPIGNKFYVNTIAIDKFSELVMSFDLRVKGMKGYKNMQAYLTALGPNAKNIIYKKTVVCVKKCVSNLNNQIVLNSPEGSIKANYKLHFFNPLLLRVCLYDKVFKQTQKIKVKDAKKGGHSKMTGGGRSWWLWATICDINYGTETVFFDNSIQLEGKDDYACIKMELMDDLDKLLTSSLEFEIYKNAAEYCALYNEHQARQPRSELFKQIFEKSYTIYMNDVDTTKDYVNSVYIKNPTFDVDSSIPDLDVILSEIYDALRVETITDLEKSLYIDVWNIFNDYIKRIHDIINFEIPEMIVILDGEQSIKMLNVVKTCIMKGLFHVLTSLFNSTNELFIRKRQSDDRNETAYIFYEVNNVYFDKFALRDVMNSIKAIYIIEFDNRQGVQFDKRFNIDQDHNGIFAVIEETPDYLNDNQSTIVPISQIDAQLTKIVEAAVDSAQAGAEEAAEEAAEAYAEAQKTAAEAAAEAQPRNSERIQERDKLRKKAAERVARLHSLRSFHCPPRAVSSHREQKKKNGGSNLEIKLISGIGSMLRNEVTNKSKYNTSTKRPKMNKKTRKNVFSLLEKRRKQTIAKKHRKNKTLRKK